MAKFNYRQSTNDPAEARLAGPISLHARIARAFTDQPQIPYFLPFFAYLLVMLPGSFGKWGATGGGAGLDWGKLWHDYLPAVYTAKTLLAAVLLWYCWPWYTRIRWARLPLGALVGLLGTLLWIGSEYACQHLGLARAPDPASLYDPDHMLSSPFARWAFLSIRVAGPTLVVPVMEELVFRDFLMRFFIQGVRFDSIPVGTFSWTALLATSLLFGLNHGFDFFIPGFLYGILMALLLFRSKSLGACITAHGVTNWSLYLYCIYTADWQFM